MQNPRDQEYSENEMLAFLKICRTSRQSFDLILSEFRCFDIPPDLGGTAPPRVGQFLQSKQFTDRLPFMSESPVETLEKAPGLHFISKMGFPLRQ